LIDFGNVGKCTPEMTDNLLLLLVALIRRNYPEIARWLIKRSTKPPRDVDTEVLALELMDTLDPHYGIGISDIRIGGLFKSLFGIMVRHAISVPAPYVHVGRTFITLEGVVRLCSPGLELLPAIQPYMSGVLKRRWAPERLMRDVRSEATEVLAALRSYPSNLAEVLARAASGQLRVESSIPELESLERSIEQASSRIPLAILICGLVISSSILLFAQASSSGSLETILGACGFITGLLLAARMVFRG
jgi:ubiquinone biosynthesis protein